jgi:hypothetical protein
LHPLASVCAAFAAATVVFARLIDHTHAAVVHVTGVQLGLLRQSFTGRHMPATQMLPAGHTTPHPPQLFVAVDVFVSQPFAGLPSQSPRLASHTNAHRPAAHTLVALARAGHAVPHALQLAGSLLRLTHAPLQLVRPAVQLVAHTPAEHTWPAAHVRPQAPQLLLSDCRSRHVPEQFVCPAAHETTQAPPLHTCPAAHVRPHAPQLLLSDCRSRHVPEQSVCPAAHESTHAPAVQICPAVHARPHAPQFKRSVCRSRQSPLHKVDPARQLTTHIPAAQISPEAQAVPQAPQLSRSV